MERTRFIFDDEYSDDDRSSVEFDNTSGYESDYMTNIVRIERERYILANERNSMDRCQARCRLLKEEMVSAVYHPSRVERWLEIGGHEYLEAMME